MAHKRSLFVRTTPCGKPVLSDRGQVLSSHIFTLPLGYPLLHGKSQLWDRTDAGGAWQPVKLVVYRFRLSIGSNARTNFP
jgi:hypothetical protein